MNPYQTNPTYNPYTGITTPDVTGLNKTFQNFAQQEQFHQAMLQNQAQMAQQAGQTQGNNSALAQLLRNNKGSTSPLSSIKDQANAYMPWTQMKVADTYGTDPYSQQSQMLAMQERGF